MRPPPDPFEAELLAAMPKLRSVARYITKSSDLADDLVQDALVKGLAARESYQLGSNMSAWLCFIARNHFYTEKRRAWRSVEMQEGQAERVPVAANAHAHVELADLMTAMSYLPAEQREALLAVGLQGEDYETAAIDLGVETGTVKSRVSRGRAALELWFSAAN